MKDLQILVTTPAHRRRGAASKLIEWGTQRADERGLINEANMHLPGRQLDPDHVRRDIARLSEWASRSSQLSMEQ